MLNVYSGDNLPRLRNDFTDFPRISKLSFPEVLFFVNVFQKRVTVASENICTLDDLGKLIESARLIPFTLKGLLKPLNEKYSTGLATDFLLKSSIQICKPKSAFDWTTKKFNKETIEANTLARKHAEKIQKLYKKESCGVLTKRFESLIKYQKQLLFLESLYEQLMQYYGDNESGNMIEIEPPKDLMEKLYQNAISLELPKKLKEMRLLDEFVNGPRVEDIIKEMEMFEEEEENTQIEVIKPERENKKHKEVKNQEIDEEQEPITKRTRGQKKGKNKQKRKNTNNDSENEPSDRENIMEEEEEWREEEDESEKNIKKRKYGKENERARNKSEKTDEIQQSKKVTKLKKLSAIEQEETENIIKSSEELLATHGLKKSNKNSEKSKENLKAEDQDLIILIEESEKQEVMKISKKEGLTDVTNNDLKASKIGSGLHKPFIAPKTAPVNAVKYISSDKAQNEKKECKPERMQIEEEEEKSIEKVQPSKNKRGLEPILLEKDSENGSKEKKKTVQEKTSKRGRPFKAEKMVQEIEEEFQQKIKSLAKKVRLEEATGVLGSSKTLTIDGKARDSKWIEEQMSRVYDWKKKYQEFVDNDKKQSGLSELVEELDDLAIKVPEMSKAIELNKTWKLWKNKAGGMNRKIKKRVEDIFDDNEDMVDIEELEKIVNEATHLRYIDSKDENLELLKAKLTIIKAIQEKFYSSGQMATLSQLKEAERKLKIQNIRIPELNILKQKVILFFLFNFIVL